MILCIGLGDHEGWLGLVAGQQPLGEGGNEDHWNLANLFEQGIHRINATVQVVLLQPYKDWLLLNRGEIRPEVGDKICIQSEYKYQEWQYWTVSSVNNNSAFLKYGNCENEIDISLFYVEIDYNPKPNLEGLLKDGYTFICTEHGLYSNCDCQDNQIKVWSDEKVDELKDDFRNITNIFKSIS